MADVEMKDSPSSMSGDSSDEKSDGNPVQSLVTGREQRKTAGNRYNRDLVLEEVGDEDDPDELALLFAGDQDEVDDEFRSDAEDEDVMSSSDDDDQGPNAGGEELEGEKELDKQRKDERAKKRKAEMALTSKSAIRKRAKIDPTAARQALPKKPTKKKERVTWLPSEDATGRTSLRKQTIAHREITLARLKESEALSKKLKAQKEKRDRERAKDAPKAMTQADRLAEAARIERRNAKSLNRWEAMEKKRSEEQAAKLAALKDRKLEGPVVTWWSGKAKWRGPRVAQVGKEGISPVENSTEPKKRGRKPKAYHEQMAAARGESIPVAASSPAQQPPLEQSTPTTRQEIIQAPQQPQPPQVTFAEPQTANDFFLSGIHDFANMQSDMTGTTTTNAATPDSGIGNSSNQVQDKPVADAPNAGSASVKQEDPIPETEATKPQPALQSPKPPEANAQETKPQSAIDLPKPVEPSEQPTNTILPLETAPSPTLSIQVPNHQPVEPVPMIEEYTTKNLVVLDKFDDLSNQDRQDYGFFFNSKRMPKLVQHRPELCPITMQLAKYRDPVTRIGYANLVAYKVLQELKEQKFAWSGMLGCYVGREGAAVARGVPEGYVQDKQG